MFDPFGGKLPDNIEIIPAVLSKSFDDIQEHLARVHDFAKKVQIDVVDGYFAKHKTWPYKDHATFDKIVAEERGLPFWGELDFEFDLMINNPNERVKEFVQAGASRIVLHATSPGVEEALRLLADMRQDDYGDFSIKTGIALLPDAQPDILASMETLYDYVQVMGIDHVGQQGEPFQPHSIALIERLRRRYPTLIISVDGGVKLENCNSLARAGANRLVVGSAIFGAEDPHAAYQALLTEANRK